MSVALYHTVLLWNGRVGLAKHERISAELTVWPPAALPGVRVEEIRYQPEIRECEVRVGLAWRPMEQHEKAACFAWLKRWAERSWAAMDTDESRELGNA